MFWKGIFLSEHTVFFQYANTQVHTDAKDTEVKQVFFQREFPWLLQISQNSMNMIWMDLSTDKLQKLRI